MQYQIDHRKVCLFIATCVLLGFVALQGSYGNPNQLAQKVYDKHKRVFQRDDVQESLPDVLEQLKSPDIQPFLLPATIGLIVDNPDILQNLVPETPDELINLLRNDAQVKRLMNDADFHELLQTPHAINALAALIRGEPLPDLPKSEVKITEIAATSQNVKLTIVGIKLNTPLDAGSTHNLTLTVKNASGELLRGAKLTFNPDPVGNSQATATFTPQQPTTNQNGKANVKVTFGAGAGDIGIYVSVTPAPRVRITELAATQQNIELSAEGIKLNTPFDAGSMHNLVITVKNASGALLRGAKLTFNPDPVGNSQATATFTPQQPTTNQNGKANVKVTLGPGAGDIGIYVSVTPAARVQITEIASITRNVQLTVEGIKLNTPLNAGSTHNLILTAKNTSGELLRGAKLTFNPDPVGNSQATVTFTPQEPMTNQNGKARVRVALGPGAGNIGIYVSVTQAPSVRITEFAATQQNVQLTVEGIKLNTPLDPGSTHNLIITVKNTSGTLLRGAKLTFNPDPVGNSQATATFTPQEPTTNQNGKARVRVALGPGAGDIGIYVSVTPAPRVRITEIASITQNVELTAAGIQLNTPLDPGSTHNLVLTVRNTNGTLLRGAKLTFNPDPVGNSQATTTFTPQEPTTDQNGIARVRVTLGSGTGDIGIYVSVTPTPRVRITEIASITQNIELTAAGIQLNTPLDAGSTHNLVLTVKNTSGTLLRGAKLTFNPDPVGNSQATTTFTPQEPTTDQNGIARVRVTLGSGTGDIGIYVSVTPAPRVRITEIASITQNIELTAAGIQLNTPLDPGSTHNLVLTVRNTNGTLLRGAKLTFNPDPVGNSQATTTFTPQEPMTDQNGIARVQVVFGAGAGGIGIYVSVTPSDQREQVPTTTEQVPTTPQEQVPTTPQEQVPTTTPEQVPTTPQEQGPVPSYFYWTAGTNINTASSDGSGYRTVLSSPKLNPELTIDPERGKIYWVEQELGGGNYGIQQANLDGSNPQDIVTGLFYSPSGIGLDVSGGKIYWSHAHPYQFGLIQRANFDGSNIEDVVIEESDEVWNWDMPTVDPVRGKIYWVRHTRGKNKRLGEIQRANLDGSNLETVINPNISVANEHGTTILQMGLDVARGQMYWLEPMGNSQYNLRRANLDGGNIQNLRTLEIGPYLSAFAVDSANGRIYLVGEDLYSVDLNGNDIETIVPYQQRNGRSLMAHLSNAPELALNTRINPVSVEVPRMPQDVWLRDSRLTLTPSSTNVPDIDVKVDADDLSTGFLPGSKHKLTFTFTRKSGEPLSDASFVEVIHDIGYTPSLTTEPEGKPQLLLAVNPRSSTRATFSSLRIIPDENGKAETEITFGSEGGVIDIDLVLPVVVFQPEITIDIEVENVDSDQNVEWEIVEGSSIPGHNQKLIFTGTDSTGKALSGYHLFLRVDPSSSATASFNPSTIEIDENGSAETEVTYGPNAGHLTIYASLSHPSGETLTYDLCLTPDPASNPEPAFGLVALENYLWTYALTETQETVGDVLVLKVKFMNGTTFEHDTVKRIAPEWSKHAGIRFDFNQSDPSDIRIRFEPYEVVERTSTGQPIGWQGVNWSSLGSAAKNRTKTPHTMLLRFFSREDKSDYEAQNRRKVLHEFGHAIGLTHEHKSPSAEFENGIDRAKLEEWIIEAKRDPAQYSVIEETQWGITNYTDFDPESIMLYPYLPLKAGGRTPWNTHLSETDQQHIGSLYPKEPLGVQRLWVSGIRNGEHIPTRTGKTITVTAYGQGTTKLPNVPIKFSKSGSASATFSETLVQTDSRGEARTRVTFRGANQYLTIYVRVSGSDSTYSYGIYVKGIEIRGRSTFDFEVKADRDLRGEVQDWARTITVPGTITNVTLSGGYARRSRWKRRTFGFFGGWEYGPWGTAGIYKDRTKWSGDTVTIYGWVEDGKWQYADAYARGTIDYIKSFLAAPSAQAQLPLETTLLPNYPNPFNPETWIPYHLATPAEVTLTIYTVDGKALRTLALGYKDAGYYQHKSRAAYWDGRNDLGERVASGIYFYSLTAGDFVATGKMLIMK